ncbi:MAG: hypothetical protein U9O94_07935 [Nanoarchaeota archaeon]|nr:hypothetical protein [Nanoarchaeota archaeon]
MPDDINVDDFIQNKKSDNFDAKLQELLGKNSKEFASDDIKVLEELCEQVWKIHVAVKSKFRHTATSGIQEKNNKLLETYADINKKLGEVLLEVKPKSEEQHYLLKRIASDKFIVALQEYFALNQDRNIQSNVLADAHERVVSETESPYYKVKELILKVKSAYDEVAVWYISKKDYRNAHNYYYMMGEIIIKEIHYGLEINDAMLYRDIDFSYMFYNAGLAFYRAYKAIKDRYIITHYAAPLSTYLRSNITDIFKNGNVQLPLDQLSIKCFEMAIPYFLKVGHKDFYLKSNDILNELKSKNNDFEKNISDLYLKIIKQFTARTNIVTKSLKKSKDILESDVRDYFLSHINVVIDEIAVAESTRGRGFSDLLVVGKNYRNEIINSIAEFKVWGRNSTGEHAYKNVINQLKGYLSDFENFGIVIMINPNKTSIRTQYISQIINSDSLLVPDSVDEHHNDFGLINFKSEFYVDNSKTRKVKIYHYILNIYPLCNQLEKEKKAVKSTSKTIKKVKRK